MKVNRPCHNTNSILELSTLQHITLAYNIIANYAAALAPACYVRHPVKYKFGVLAFLLCIPERPIDGAKETVAQHFSIGYRIFLRIKPCLPLPSALGGRKISTYLCCPWHFREYIVRILHFCSPQKRIAHRACIGNIRRTLRLVILRLSLAPKHILSSRPVANPAIASRIAVQRSHKAPPRTSFNIPRINSNNLTL